MSEVTAPQAQSSSTLSPSDPTPSASLPNTTSNPSDPPPVASRPETTTTDDNLPGTSADKTESASGESKEKVSPAPIAQDQKAAPAEPSSAADEPTEDTTMASIDASIEQSSTTLPLNGTPASTKKENKRKSTGVPEHKTKKLQKKKSQANLNLNVEPGEYYLIKLKGYSPWPAVVADEDMLPQALLQTRPTTARRPDGNFSEACADGGKRMADRTFPVMFMATNEFGWTNNKDMIKYDVTGAAPEKGKSASLLQAYALAKEGHGLDHWKGVLRDHQQAMIEDAEMKASKKAEKRRKSEAKIAAAEDEEMPDADDAEEGAEGATKTPKKGKKRPKGADSEGDNAKPSKIAKSEPVKTTKIKISTPRAPNGTATAKSATKDSSTKAKSKAKKPTANGSEDEEMADAETKVEKKPLSIKEQQEMRQKEVLYLRHKLQRCFLSSDQPPKPEEMKTMSEFIHKLEQYRELEVSIIRATKIHKVLKNIIKLSSIPLDSEYNFRQRSTDLLAVWNGLLNNDPATAPQPSIEGPSTNGVAKASDSKAKDEKSASPTKSTPKPAASPKEAAAPADTPMEDAPAASKDAKASPSDAAEAEKPASAAAPESEKPAQEAASATPA